MHKCPFLHAKPAGARQWGGPWPALEGHHSACRALARIQWGQVPAGVTEMVVGTLAGGILLSLFGGGIREDFVPAI